ncbi:MAG TPA: carboxylesterase family protein [Gemmatimonadaceae bacterium]|nr:carboxylesterase family protein [Gemmatimonadaceae bacterium]
MALPWLLVTLALVQQTGPVVRVESGALEGTIDSATGVQVFRGVPYTGPHWTGVRRADHLGKNCLQQKVYDDIDAAAAGMSKDCFFLNIWTTGAPNQAVMFWIHGGGFKAGFGGEARHNGARLAKKGVVVVTINYRLGKYGFSDRNYGLMDQITALQWVRRNIAQFGGDTSRITIFGESAGGMSVGALMVSPPAKGLFARAILESGTGIHTDILHPDGHVPPGPIDSLLAHGSVKPVPVIVGNNKDEPDSLFGAPARLFARLVTERGVRVYRYVFTYAQDSLGAYHSAEIPFVFDLAKPPLAETMSDYWIAFAKTGDPNGDDRPRWPVATVTSDPYLELGAAVAARSH